MKYNMTKMRSCVHRSISTQSEAHAHQLSPRGQTRPACGTTEDSGSVASYQSEQLSAESKAKRLFVFRGTSGVGGKTKAKNRSPRKLHENSSKALVSPDAT